MADGLIFAFVARAKFVLAESTAFSGNFVTVAQQCLEKLPPKSGRFSYVCDNHTFNFLTEDDFTFMVLAGPAAGGGRAAAVPFAFLERLRADFRRRLPPDAAAAAGAHSLDRQYGPRLQELLDDGNAHPEELDRVAKTRAQLNEVKGVMMEGIEKVLERGDRIELLVEKTDSLRFQAEDFHRQGRQLRRELWLRDAKLKLAAAAAASAVLLVAGWLTVCHGFTCR